MPNTVKYQEWADASEEYAKIMADKLRIDVGTDAVTTFNELLELSNNYLNCITKKPIASRQVLASLAAIAHYTHKNV